MRSKVLHNRIYDIRSVDLRDLVDGPNHDDTKHSTTEAANDGEQLKDFIVEITEDLKDLENYYNVSLSRKRIQTIGEYLVERSNEMVTRFLAPIYAGDDQQARVDWRLIRSFATRRDRELKDEWERLDEIEALVSDWVEGLVDLCERRQGVVTTTGKHAGDVLSKALSAIKTNTSKLNDGSFEWSGSKVAAFRGAQQLEDLKKHLTEWKDFYTGYDPTFTWWMAKPWTELSNALEQYVSAIREHLVGIHPGDQDAIVGQPIGRTGILEALDTEFIAYSPEELIEIAEKQYKWCEQEAIKASKELGFGDNWRAAQEKVKNMYVEPGQQTRVTHELAQKAIDYVIDNDMVTVPDIAKKYWRTFMMSPARQKVNPFFLGGSSVIVSYPTDEMSHGDKLMVMRGNNRSFSNAVVLHELIPGHHLQWYYMSRFKTHRSLFQTPFWTEGWAFYWELILWDRGYQATPEDRIGALFWHMHRCIRILFSINFHLGEWTPEQCIDALVDRVGHERATAEGEVRRSFNGDYGPLYQAGYMLGALQFYQLRKEMVEEGSMTEKDFHDAVLKNNNMPIEMLRNLLQGREIGPSYKPSWRFYDLDKDSHTC